MTNHPPPFALTQRLLILLCAVVVLCRTQAHAQSIQSLRGSALEVALTEAGDNRIRIPVTVAADSGPVSLRLTDVTFDNPARAISTAAFDAAMEKDTLGNDFLNIVVHNKQPLDQGKYHLLFNILKGRPVQQPETFALDLTVKPATLATIANQVAAREQDYPWGPYTPAYKPITLFENSRNATIFPVTIRQLALTDPKGAEVSTGSIEFPNTNLPVMAGRQENFSYRVNGNLPIGTVSGSFEINAPQLAAPVVFKLDVITRRSGWWIILIILAGLVSGFLIRKALEGILQLNRSRKAAIEFYEQLQAEKSSRPDEKFRKAIDGFLAELGNAMNKSAADIDKAVADVRTKLPDAFTEFNNSQAALQTAVTAFSDALAGVWFLPEGIEKALTAAMNDVKAVNAAIQANNPGAGVIALQALRLALSKELIAETTKFKNTLKEAYAGIRQSPLKIATAESPLLKTVEELEKSAAAIPGDAFEEKPENIRALLQAVTAQRRGTAAMFFDLSLTIKLLADALTDILASGNITLKELPEIRGKADLKFNLQSDKALDTALANVKADMSELQRDMLAAFTNPELALTADQAKKIRDAINGGQYTDAANSLLEFKKPLIVNESGFENTAGGMQDGEDIATLPADRSASAPFQFGRNTGVALFPQSAARPFSKTDMSTGSQRFGLITRTIFVTSLVQTLLIGFGIAIFGYPLFVEKFTGTVTDMIEIFSWAFVMDVSLNTLTSTAGGVPKTVRP